MAQGVTTAAGVMEELAANLRWRVDSRLRFVEWHGSKLLRVVDKLPMFGPHTTVKYIVGLRIGDIERLDSVSAAMATERELVDKVFEIADALIAQVDRIKARDIVPSWPRGRSTLPEMKLEVPFAWCWSVADQAMLEDEQDSDRRYHEAQDRMMAEWRAVSR